TARVRIPAGVSVTSGGLLTLHSTEAADSSSTANGSATTSGSLGIGAAVAITLANVTNEARIDGTTSSSGVALTADMPASASDDLSAHATSGAGGGGSVSVAGSDARVRRYHVLGRDERDDEHDGVRRHERRLRCDRRGRCAHVRQQDRDRDDVP